MIYSSPHIPIFFCNESTWNPFFQKFWNTQYGFKKQGKSVLCDNMSEPGGHRAKWNKPGSEKLTLHDLTVCELQTIKLTEAESGVLVIRGRQREMGTGMQRYWHTVQSQIRGTGFWDLLHSVVTLLIMIIHWVISKKAHLYRCAKLPESKTFAMLNLQRAVLSQHLGKAVQKTSVVFKVAPGPGENQSTELQVQKGKPLISRITYNSNLHPLVQPENNHWREEIYNVFCPANC